MLERSTAPKSGENTWLWLLKIISGVLVIVLLFVHLVVNHLVPSEGLLSYEEVIAYVTTPGIALMEMTFLVVVVSHSLIGLRSIILDLNPSPGVLRVVNWVLTLIGVAAVVYGIWLMQMLVAQAA